MKEGRKIANIKEKISGLLELFLKEKNLELYDVVEVKESGNHILQILIDKENGIDVDSLTLVNNYLSEKLDEIEYRESYYLEVSSPGAEKLLRNHSEIEKAIGRYIFVKTDNQEQTGYLRAVTPEKIIIEVNQKGRIRKIEVETKSIRLIRLAIKF
ncbi:MAG: hypothetical protein FWE36_00730 [Erysipelotrichales bacterium]|nr:hypothetical protein [Erysipelotrichales bacterium]